MPRFRHREGFGKHRFVDGTISRPGFVTDDLPKSPCADKFEQLDPNPPAPQPSVGLRVHPRGGGWFDVINDTTGDAVNDRPMRFDAASELASAGLEEIEASEGADSEEIEDETD